MAINPYDDILKRAQTELSKDEQQKLSETLSSHAGRKNGGAHQITDLRGLGKDVWKDVDADEYVAGERNAWDG